MRTLFILVLVVLGAAAWWHYKGSSGSGVIQDEYVGHSTEECMRIRFVCVEGKEYFQDDKGCGCRAVAQ